MQLEPSSTLIFREAAPFVDTVWRAGLRGTFFLVCLHVSLAACTPAVKDTDGEPETAAPVEIVLAEPVHHLDELAREPMLVEHPTGTIFVSGYGGTLLPKRAPHLWKSTDGGASWERVDVGTPEEGAYGNSCVDLAVAPDGTLYFVTMGFDRDDLAGKHVTVGTSRDVGASWTWAYLSQDEYDDRPWIEVAPDGKVHVIWNDGAGVSYATSNDSGATWEERPRIHPQGGSSHLAIGPRGEVAVSVTPLSASGNQFDEGVELIAVSTDGGQSWDKHPVPGSRVWSPEFVNPDTIPRWVEPLAWGPDGALYSFWSEGQELWLARSRTGARPGPAGRWCA